MDLFADHRCADELRRLLAAEVDVERGDVLAYRVCVHCGATDRLEVHHRIPLAAGGTNALANLELKSAAAATPDGTASRAAVDGAMKGRTLAWASVQECHSNGRRGRFPNELPHPRSRSADEIFAHRDTAAGNQDQDSTERHEHADPEADG